jgi:Kdo2-lipid IVA lauroyltransferase/acyltransferase
MQNFLTKLLYGAAWLLALLPLRLLYLLSPVLFFIAYYFPGYRKRVVYDNLVHSFPEKADADIRKIRKQFYWHFCDLIVEILKGSAITQGHLSKRLRFKNMELINNMYDAGKNPVLLSGHYGNWEWMLLFPAKIRHKFLVLYRPLRSKTFDDIMNRLRSRFGIVMIADQVAYRHIIRYDQQGVRHISWFLADQTPLPEAMYWTSFMNREAPFFRGGAKLAMRTGQPVIYMNIQKVKRGYYEVEFTTLFDSLEGVKENEIIEKYVQKLEEDIRNAPQYWLWTHKRWKHQRNV